MSRFVFHHKVVTLNLAYHSVVCAEKPELLAAIGRARDCGYDLTKVKQVDVERIYAEFDDELEKQIVSEFQADPYFLVDLKWASGICPLCGHVGLRWLFKVRNRKNGKEIQCGSECIISWGVSVRGAETAEHAKKILEATIRRRIKQIQIEQWHEDYDFSEACFDRVREHFGELPRPKTSADYYRRLHIKKLFRQLRCFYDKNGWLNTAIRWGNWCEAINYLRSYGCNLDEPKPFSKAEIKRREKAKKAEIEGPPEPEKTDKPQQTDLFADISSRLVFGVNDES